MDRLDQLIDAKEWFSRRVLKLRNHMMTIQTIHCLNRRFIEFLIGCDSVLSLTPEEGSCRPLISPVFSSDY
jgi:hypothetical protein